MEVYKDEQYCVFHLSKDLDMVDCPLDPEHKVARKKLDSHLKKCNVNKLKQEQKSKAWYAEGQTVLKDNEQPKEGDKKALKGLFAEDSPIFWKFIDRLPIVYENGLKIYADYLKQFNMEVDFKEDDFDQDLLQISDNEKDLKQVQLLCKLMGEMGLLDDKLSYIEYGAGKGRFSHEIAENVEAKCQQRHACHVLIEREPRKLKFDRFHRQNPYFMRCRIDISDFNLGFLEQELKQRKYFEQKQLEEVQLVGVCKHMCGGATDLTLRSLLQQGQKLKGLMIATCCHHLCDRQSYVNIQFLSSIDVEEQMIDLLFQCSSWYVSGPIRYGNGEEAVKKVKQERELSSEQRTKLGKMAKRLIDMGRCMYVSEQTKRPVVLMKYCAELLSPENYVILQKYN